MANRLFLILTSLVMLSVVRAAELKPDVPLRPEVKKLVAPGLENVFVLSTNIISGDSPHDDARFQSLKKLGVKTIISVDGSQPDLKRAHAAGMRYIHLPHGYDGVSAQIQLQLIKAAQIVEGPIYVHCHHGKHRGPTAAAVMCMANNGWTTNEALAWLQAAGTGSNYHGLYQTVRAFKKPDDAVLKAVPASFPEAQKVSGLIDSMVLIDETFDRLKTLRAVASPMTPGPPDNHLLNEATLLREHFRESRRLGESREKGAEFLKALTEAENLASAFEEAVSASADRAAMERTFQQLTKSCAACHRAHRDEPGLGGKNGSPLPR